MPLLELAAVAVCIVVGGLFASADAAVTALPESRLRALISDDPGKHQEMRRVLADTHTVLARFLVGRVVCTVVAAVVLTRALAGWTYGALLGGIAVILAYGILAEVAMSLVRRRASELAEVLLRIVRPFEIAVLPLAAPLAILGRSIASLDRRPRADSDPQESARIAEREVEFLIEKGQRSGVLQDGDLLQAAVEFKKIVVAQVRVPRTRMVALEVKTPLLRVLELISAEGHSRYPIYDGKIDEVVGLLYVKDLFRLDREGKLASKTLADLARKPVLYVQENQEVDAVLKEMRTKALHMAVVVDEFGGTAGLVTLEDILELLVGDIRDELDDEEPMQDLGGGRLLVDAAVPVNELEQRMGVELPHRDGSFVSVGGLVMEQLGRVPVAGTVVRVGALDLVIREADERRVRRIEVVRHVDTP
ncbi:MAG: hemolysin family protein [Polyangiales bacterium]